MKVIYDISVLGLAHYYKAARTGVYRVVENVARELLHQDCQISFSATHALFETIKYLNTSKEFQGVPICSWSNPLMKYIYETIINLTYPNPKGILKKHVRIWASVLKRIIMQSRMINNYFESVDIYHSPYFPLPVHIKSTKTQRFLTVHDLIPIIHPEFFTNAKDHMINEVVNSISDDDWIITVSESTKNDLCNHSKIKPERVFVIHLAASDLFYKCEDNSINQLVRKKYGISDFKYILSLSTLEPRKNIEQTIKCFINMIQQQNINDLNLVFVGTKGWNYKGIISKIKNSGKIKDRIIVTGYVADHDLAPLYSCASMFLFPSFYEGFGLPLLEAMQCGTPIIASNTSSIPEVVGDAGFLIDPKDSESLCECMYKVYNDSSLAHKMSLASLDRAKMFNWKKCGQEVFKAYEYACSNL